MSSPQMQQQVVPSGPIRLADLALMAGPREIEFEIELPKGSEWDLEGENTLVVSSSVPSVTTPGQAMFQPVSMRFMVPLSAYNPGEAVLTYGLCVSWIDRSGTKCCDRREVVQRITVEADRGATVPWVHYKAQANQ